MTMLLISASLIAFLLGFFVETPRVTGTCWLIAGVILLVVAAPWLLYALRNPGDMEAAVLAILAIFVTLWNLFKGVQMLRFRDTEAVDG